jgi:3-hydroxyisobutyrate dehydrogenase
MPALPGHASVERLLRRPKSVHHCRMAANLVKAGHQVTGFDIAAGKAEALAKTGGRLAASAIEAAAAGEVIITMLPAGAEVRSVYLGDDGVLAHARPGTLLIDCSTIDVETARAVAAAATEARFEVLDAPVSGGVIGAETASLTFMVGGGVAAFVRARPVLAAMGRTIVHAGAAGNGQAAKICNNMILGVSMITVCEAFSLAERLGLAAQTLFDISAKSSGQCWALTSYCPVPGPVPASPANRDLRARLHRGDDAEGFAAGATGGRRERRSNAARCSGRQPVPVVCRRGRRQLRFFGNLSLPSQARS